MEKAEVLGIVKGCHFVKAEGVRLPDLYPGPVQQVVSLAQLEGYFCASCLERVKVPEIVAGEVL